MNAYHDESIRLFETLNLPGFSECLAVLEVLSQKQDSVSDLANALVTLGFNEKVEETVTGDPRVVLYNPYEHVTPPLSATFAFASTRQVDLATLICLRVQDTQGGYHLHLIGGYSPHKLLSRTKDIAQRTLDLRKTFHTNIEGRNIVATRVAVAQDERILDILACLAGFPRNHTESLVNYFTQTFVPYIPYERPQSPSW